MKALKCSGRGPMALTPCYLPGDRRLHTRLEHHIPHGHRARPLPPSRYDKHAMLRSRTDERHAISQLLDAARDGRGGCLILRGEPGIGKSALLADARRIAGGMQVLSVSGVEGEASLAFAALLQLLQPVQAGVDDLPPPQRHALR